MYNDIYYTILGRPLHVELPDRRPRLRLLRPLYLCLFVCRIIIVTGIILIRIHFIMISGGSSSSSSSSVLAAGRSGPRRAS